MDFSKLKVLILRLKDLKIAPKPKTGKIAVPLEANDGLAAVVILCNPSMSVFLEVAPALIPRLLS
jgi:hypothetical protein